MVGWQKVMPDVRDYITPEMMSGSLCSRPLPMPYCHFLSKAMPEASPSSKPCILIQLWADIDLHAQLLLRRILFPTDSNKGEDASLLLQRSVCTMRLVSFHSQM